MPNDVHPVSMDYFKYVVPSHNTVVLLSGAQWSANQYFGYKQLLVPSAFVVICALYVGVWCESFLGARDSWCVFIVSALQGCCDHKAKGLALGFYNSWYV